MNDTKTAVTAGQMSIRAFAMPESELLAALESTCYPGANLLSVKLLVNVCRAQQLDPFQKPYHIVPMNVKKAKSNDYEWRDVVMPGVGLYRTQAARTGAFAGIDEGAFGPTIQGGFSAGKAVAYPEWCSVTVYRIVQGERVSFSSGKVYWLESYATVKRDSDVPNSMWAKRPFGQLEKCAEALALRRAFPEVGASPTAEEMEGRVIDGGTGEIITERPSAPKEPEKKADKLKERLRGARTIDVAGEANAADKPIKGEPKGPAAEDIAKMFDAASTKEKILECIDLARGFTDPADKELLNAAYHRAKGRMDSLEKATETVHDGGAATATLV